MYFHISRWYILYTRATICVSRFNIRILFNNLFYYIDISYILICFYRRKYERKISKMTKLEKIILELNNDEIESLLITDIKNNSLAIKIANAINTQTGWVARNSDKIDWYDHKKDTCNHEYDEKVFDVSDVPEDITMSFVKRALFFNECKLCGHIKYDTKSFGIIWR